MTGGTKTWRTVGQAAKALDVTERTIWARIARGQIESAVQDGRRVVRLGSVPPETEASFTNLQSIFQSNPGYRRDVARILRELAGLLEGDCDGK